MPNISDWQLIRETSNAQNIGNSNGFYLYAGTGFLLSHLTSIGTVRQFRLDYDGCIYTRLRRDWVNWNDWVKIAG